MCHSTSLWPARPTRHLQRCSRSVSIISRPDSAHSKNHTSVSMFHDTSVKSNEINEAEQRKWGTRRTIRTRSSSNTPLLIFPRISLQASSNAFSTFSPFFALASTNNRPSSCAQSCASSTLTCRLEDVGVVDLDGAVVGVGVVVEEGCDVVCDCAEKEVWDGDEDEDGDGGQRSDLFPTRIQVRCGSACFRTSSSHVRAFRKPTQ